MRALRVSATVLAVILLAAVGAVSEAIREGVVWTDVRAASCEQDGHHRWVTYTSASKTTAHCEQVGS
jgi:hypothetical protein